MRKPGLLVESYWRDVLSDTKKTLIVFPAAIILALTAVSFLIMLINPPTAEIGEAHKPLMAPGGTPVDFIEVIGLAVSIILICAGILGIVVITIIISGILVIKIFKSLFLG